MNDAPTEIRLKRAERVLQVTFADGVSYALPFEYLRVFSPSAEVRGHGLSEPMLVKGKERVMVTAVEPIGNYAVKLNFDDGHDTGLYTWSFLRELGAEQAKNMARYKERLAAEPR
jgi:DUF971 family protein